MTPRRHRPVANEAELLLQHAGLALHISDAYFLPGQDRDDVRQEALVGLLIGIRSYEPGRGTSLRTYAAMSVRAWLNWKVRQATKLAAVPLTDAVRERHDEDGATSPAVEWLADPGSDPTEIVERRERFSRFVDSFSSLTEIERNALLAVYEGVPYTTLPGAKRVDNACQRARRKLRRAA